MPGGRDRGQVSIPVLLVSSLLGLETFLSRVGKGQCSCPSPQPGERGLLRMEAAGLRPEGSSHKPWLFLFPTLLPNNLWALETDKGA